MDQQTLIEATSYNRTAIINFATRSDRAPHKFWLHKRETSAIPLASYRMQIHTAKTLTAIFSLLTCSAGDLTSLSITPVSYINLSAFTPYQILFAAGPRKECYSTLSMTPPPQKKQQQKTKRNNSRPLKNPAIFSTTVCPSATNYNPPYAW